MQYSMGSEIGKHGENFRGNRSELYLKANVRTGPYFNDQDWGLLRFGTIFYPRHAVTRSWL